MERYACLLLLLFFVSFEATSGTVDPWRAFALDRYVDKENGNGGRCPEPYQGGWELRTKQRAPSSLVEATSVSVTDEMSSAIRAALSPVDLPPGFVLPRAQATVWRARGGGVLLVFNVSAPSERTEQMQFWDEGPGRLVEQPAFAHQLSAALWFFEGRAILIDYQVKADADLETYRSRFAPVDIVDIDADGKADVVLRMDFYESEQLHIFTIQGTRAVSRLRLQGCSV